MDWNKASELALLLGRHHLYSSLPEEVRNNFEEKRMQCAAVGTAVWRESSLDESVSWILDEKIVGSEFKAVLEGLSRQYPGVPDQPLTDEDGEMALETAPTLNDIVAALRPEWQSTVEATVQALTDLEDAHPRYKDITPERKRAIKESMDQLLKADLSESEQARLVFFSMTPPEAAYAAAYLGVGPRKLLINREKDFKNLRWSQRLGIETALKLPSERAFKADRAE